MNESYRRGRSVLERAAVANAPSPTLSAADCADVMHLIRSSELPTDETADAGLRHAQRLVEHFLRSTDSAV